ncbi:MAG: kelch repeat-containing protein [Desulfuromonadaceae bacterium]
MKAWRCFAGLFSICIITFALQGCGGGGGGESVALPPPTITDINGGITGSGTVGSLFIIDGNNFGNLSAPAAGFSVDFRDTTTNAVVASAPVNYAAGNWTNTIIKGTVPNAPGITAGTIYKVTVTTTSGTTSGVNFLVVASVAFSPSTITWSTAATLPVAKQGFPTIIAPVFRSFTSSTKPVFKSFTSATNYVYTLGGNTSTATAPDKSANVASVFLNKMVNATGALADPSWTATTPLPDKRGFATGVLANTFNSKATGYGTLYVLGGLDGTGNATSTVYVASISSDGTLPASGTGSWTTTTQLPQPLFAAAAVIFHNRLYVVGGNNSTGAPVANVYSAVINSDGTLGSWQTLADLPTPLAYHQMVTVGGFLYVLGGDNAAVDPITNVASLSEQDSIYFGQINLLDGSLATWTKNSSGMGKAREKFTAVAAGDAVVVTGGLYNGSPGSSESRYGTINTDGSLTPFAGATGTNTISTAGGYNPYNHSTAYFVDNSGNPHILILGGADVATGLLHPEVWYQL